PVAAGTAAAGGDRALQADPAGDHRQRVRRMGEGAEAALLRRRLLRPDLRSVTATGGASVAPGRAPRRLCSPPPHESPTRRTDEHARPSLPVAPALAPPVAGVRPQPRPRHGLARRGGAAAAGGADLPRHGPGPRRLAARAQGPARAV